MPRRIDQVNKELFRQISALTTRLISLKPGVFVTVTKVDTSADLRYARVFVSVFPEAEENYGLTALENGLGEIRHELSKDLSLHHLPQIQFRIDHTPAHADEIEHIIKQIHEEDQ